jgi:hypothetical protein
LAIEATKDLEGVDIAILLSKFDQTLTDRGEVGTAIANERKIGGDVRDTGDPVSLFPKGSITTIGNQDQQRQCRCDLPISTLALSFDRSSLFA